MDVGASGNNIKSKDPEPVVNYMGTPWIVRRSKSQNGMRYFFNTMTNEAVWNLNDSEIEKAKKLTKSLGNQMENIQCPEPKEPPRSNSHESIAASQQIPSRIYNKQTINNQIQQQPLANFPQTSCQVLPIRLNVSGPAFNSNIWAVPPIFGTSSLPMIQQAQPSVNVMYNEQDYKVPVENSAIYLSSIFSSHSPNRGAKSPLKRNNFQRNHNQHFVQRNYRRKLGSNDLRNVLSARTSHTDVKYTRRKSDYCHHYHMNRKRPTAKHRLGQWDEFKEGNETAFGEQSSYEMPNNIFENNKTFEKYQTSYLSDVDIDDLEDEMKRKTLNLDFSKLKQLAGSNANPEHWYIVADKSILLNHLNFLHILINSDERCRLMVPREVMDELRVSARTSCGMPRSTNRGRRAVLFVSEQLNSGRCLLGEPFQDNTITSCYILRCCLQLTQQNYDVILLTNDKELQEIKRLLSIPIFTIKEIKQYLTVTSTTSENTPEPLVNFTEKNVKITIDNDLMTSSIEDTSEISNNEEQAPDNNIRKYQYSVASLNSEACPDLFRKEPSQSQPCSRKKTIDAAVQTESPAETALIQIDQPTTTTPTPPLPQPNVQNSIGTILSSDTQNNTVASQCVTVLKEKRRLIRHSTSHQSKISNSSCKKKQFKWRKRRNASKTHADIGLVTTFDKSRLDSSNKDSLNADIDGNSAQIQNIVTESINQTSNTLCDDIVEDEEEDIETGSIIHRDTNEKIVIEETSTSGVISNTTSRGDSESESVRQHEVSFNEEEMRQNIMFNVIDQSMEQSLRMKCDEWVSRYVQIMEEALTQLLQRNDQILRNILPPPWTLYEATHCIKITFKGNRELLKACSKLLNILDTVSDGGRINLDLNPSDYMEMYSYGVYLIDILQSTSQNCEDLQTASDSLSILLNDIRNPTGDVHYDSFCDNTRLKNVEKRPSIIGRKAHSRSQPKDSVNDLRTYNLRSNNKKAEQDKQQTEEQKIYPKTSGDVSFIRNVDIQHYYMKSLHLQKKETEFSVSNDLDMTGETCEGQANDFSKYHRRECTVNGHLDSKDNNFKTGPEFEEKLRNKSREILDMDQLDYSEDVEESYDDMDDDYYSEEECCNEELVHNKAVNVDAESTDLAITKLSGNIEKPKFDINANNNFASIFSKLLLEIKEAFLKVQLFCKETENELAGTQNTRNRKNEILKNTEKAHLYIDQLRGTLHSVLYRESCTGSNNIQSVLHQLGLVKVNDILLGEYRVTISKCMDQAKVLLDSLDLIKSAISS